MRARFWGLLRENESWVFERRCACVLWVLLRELES